MATNTGIEPRRYRVISLLGEGGFGRVYRANLEGAEGFRKEVAIKLLHGTAAETEALLARFRDEARILGLVRDRAIVNVDPPTRFGGKWAIVMEYVDGCSLSKLIEKEPLPVSCALEIVAEVARALDKVYNQPGPDGTPLHLMHRDIKPQNLQLTPSGEVKILDFGIARASFDGREAKTSTGHVGGTIGYIAPERIMGEESPAADVFSLGVMLHKVITMKMPGQKVQFVLDENQEAALALSRIMRSETVEDRPNARESEKRCKDLIKKIDGVSLRDWAEKAVPAAVSRTPDEMVGSMLTETLAAIPRAPENLPPDETGGKTGRSAFTVLAAGSTVALFGAVAVAVVVFVLVAGIGLFVANQSGAFDGAMVDSTPVPNGTDIKPAPVPSGEGTEAVADLGTDVEPSPKPGVTPKPKPVDGVVAVEGTEKAEGTEKPVVAPAPKVNNAGSDGCTAEAAEAAAAMGELGSDTRVCVQEKARDPGLKMTEREKYSRVLLVNDQTICKNKGDCDPYVTTQEWYFEEIGQSDPNMTFGYAEWIYLNRPLENAYGNKVLKWSQKALDEKAKWTPTIYVKRVDRLMEMRAKVTYAQWAAADSVNRKDADALANKVRTEVFEWRNFRLNLGVDTTEADKICKSATGSEDRCRVKASEAAGTFDVDFASIPPGAFISVDKALQGNAPKRLALAQGPHEISMKLEPKGGGEAIETKLLIEVNKDSPKRYNVDINAGKWTAVQ